jgi:hypothetical protein
LCTHQAFDVVLVILSNLARLTAVMWAAKPFFLPPYFLRCAFISEAVIVISVVCIVSNARHSATVDTAIKKAALCLQHEARVLLQCQAIRQGAH